MLSSPEGTVSLLMLTPNGALSLQMLILSSADATVSMLMLSSNGALSLLPTKGVLSLLLSAKGNERVPPEPSPWRISLSAVLNSVSFISDFRGNCFIRGIATSCITKPPQ
ncbi:hypothetical protein PR002_g16817 [Phytophthora rubi]|uniref:Uncharacterized protein n=1 Tax=Phytophthora rubi TaxID=129364 RepID=A0A6A3KJV3_9STRA|nr:hypothetical protein PR002_g16817 [Phytophthora rubi]